MLGAARGTPELAGGTAALLPLFLLRRGRSAAPGGMPAPRRRPSPAPRADSMRGAAASVLPLTFAILLGLGDCQRDLAARLEPGASRRADPRRLRGQTAPLGATGTAPGLPRPHRAPPEPAALPAALRPERGPAESPNDGRRQRPEPGLGPAQGLQPSRQRPRSALKARVAPRAKEPNGRGRMAG